MIAMTTNVDPTQLNYDRYAIEEYDDGIVRSIPGHEEMHKHIDDIVTGLRSEAKILELGIGTGLTASVVLKNIPSAKYVGIDLSETMLNSAKKRLAEYNIEYVVGDYSKLDFPGNNDLVVSVIGIHHQATDADKKNLFQKIYDCLSEAGAFIFGDLVTYRNPEAAAMNDALHYHYLVENAKDEKSLKEWAYHHKFLNRLAPVESQVEWLKEVGFSQVDVIYTKYNTALVYARK